MITNDAILDEAVKTLLARGFTVRLPAGDGGAPMRIPKELAYELALSPAALTARLRHPMCPPFHARRGPTGRIIELAASAELMDFLRKPKQPGRALR